MGFCSDDGCGVDAFADGLSHLIVPEMTTVIEIKGKPVAVTFGLLDYNPLVKKINGRLFPFGFLHLLLGRKRLKRVRMVGTYVAPAYQGWGLSLVLLHRLIDEFKAWGIEDVEFSYVLESNLQSKTTLERGGAKVDRVFRLYDKTLDP